MQPCWRWKESIMLVAEVLELADWIDKNFEKNSLAETYTALINILAANANRQSQPFDTEREELNAAVGVLDTKNLSDAQVHLLKEIGGYDSIGQHGVSVLRDIFVENAIDIQTARNRVEELKSAIDKATTWANDTKETLGSLFEEDNSIHTTGPLEVIIRVRFTDEAGIYNVVDLKKWSSVWYDILRGFALAIKASPEDYKFVGGTKGSLIALFASEAVNVAAIVISVERALAFANNVLDFKLKIKELKESPFETAEVIKAIEKSLKNERENAPDIVATEVENELGLSKNDGEQKDALRKSLKKMFDFFEKGGEVDFVVPSDETEATDGDYQEAFEQLKKIRAGVEKIRVAQRTTVLLEDNSEKK